MQSPTVSAGVWLLFISRLGDISSSIMSSFCLQAHQGRGPQQLSACAMAAMQLRQCPQGQQLQLALVPDTTLQIGGGGGGHSGAGGPEMIRTRRRAQVDPARVLARRI